MRATLSRNEVINAVASHYSVTMDAALRAVQKLEQSAALKRKKEFCLELVSEIQDDIQQVEQWSNCRDPMVTGWWASAHEHASRGEALLAFLELQFCGSVGGFYPGQTPAQRDTFQDRLDFVRALVEKL